MLSAAAVINTLRVKHFDHGMHCWPLPESIFLVSVTTQMDIQIMG